MKRLSLVVAGVVLAFLALELGVRWMLLYDRNFIDAIDSRPAPELDAPLDLADLIQRHPDDRVVFELRPSIRGRFLGVDVRINSHGMRGRERPIEKAPGVFRIVGLGDSHGFGWGTPEAEVFYERLEALLNGRLAPRRFEVWNASVPGYNTVQEVRAFRLRAKALRPDLVIVNYVHNDMDLPNVLATPPDPLSIDVSYLAEVVRRRWWTFQGRSGVAPLLLFGIDPDPRSGRFLLDERRTPARFRKLAGWERMEAAFGRLAAYGRAEGFPVALLVNSDDYRARLAGRTEDVRPGAVRGLCERLAPLGYQIVDPQDRITAHLREHGLPANVLWLSERDSHTSSLRHQLVAEELFDALSRAGGPIDARR